MEDLFIKNTNLEKPKIILKIFNQYLSNTIKKLEDEEEVSIVEINELIKLIVSFKKKTEIKLESLDSDSDSENESTSSLMKLESTEDNSSIKSNEDSDKEDSDKEDSDKEDSDKQEKIKEIKKKPEDSLYLSFINEKPFLKVLSNPNYDIFKNVEKFIKNSFVY
jgi:hypothetical protein